MRHGPLRRLHQHREYRLLQREAEVSLRIGRVTRGGHVRARADLGVLPRLEQRVRPVLDGGEDPGEADVHPLDGVGQREEGGPVLGALLDVVARARVVAEADHPGEPVQAVAHRDVDGLPEYPVALLAVGDHLRVAAADVEHGGVLGAGDESPHLDVADAVVDADDGLVPELGHGARHHGHAGEGRAHARALGVGHGVDLVGGDVGLLQRLPQHGEHVGAVVARRVPGQEPLARRRDVGPPRVGEHLAILHTLA